MEHEELEVGGSDLMYRAVICCPIQSLIGLSFPNLVCPTKTGDHLEEEEVLHHLAERETSFGMAYQTIPV